MGKVSNGPRPNRNHRGETWKPIKLISPSPKNQQNVILSETPCFHRGKLAPAKAGVERRISIRSEPALSLPMG